MADILLCLSREAPLDILNSTNSYLTNEMPEYMGSVSVIEADRIVTVDQATQTQSVEELLRQSWVDGILDHPMYYTGLKSKELLQYILNLCNIRQIGCPFGEELVEPKGRQTSTRSRNLSTWEEFLLAFTRIQRGLILK